MIGENKILTVATYYNFDANRRIAEMILQEVVLCATVPLAAGSGSGAVVLHDIQTGSSLASFKQSSSAPHCTSFVETRDGQGGFILAAQQDKSILNVYNFQKVCLVFLI
jgi:pre-rRNA-processing protein IPI3